MVEDGGTAKWESLGITAPQYLEEGLRLHVFNNHLIERPGDVTEFKRLNAIVDIDFDEMGDFERTQTTQIDGPAFEWVIVNGHATLFDGTKRKVQLEIVKKSTGGYHLDVTVG